MLAITDLKNGTKFIYEGDPFVVLSYSQSKMGRGGSVVKVRIKNLKNGNVLTKTFQGADKFESADLARRKANFLYSDEKEANFMDLENFDQFSIPISQIGDQNIYLKEGTDIDILLFNNTPINIELPIKMKFMVVDAPPAIKGNSAGAVTKKARIEGGGEIDVPIFIKQGDIIVVDTRDGSYVERG
ncbi:MAG: Elongation factor P [bacterium ADurb.Bin212]|nr:MAG: Elongation factor P [bacterium ADurb.Bin212]